MNPVEELFEFEKTAAGNKLLAKMRGMFLGGKSPMQHLKQQVGMNKLVNAVAGVGGQLPGATGRMPGHLHDLIEHAGNHGFAARVGGPALARTADTMGDDNLPGKLVSKVVDAAIDQANAKELANLRDTFDNAKALADHGFQREQQYNQQVFQGAQKAQELAANLSIEERKIHANLANARVQRRFDVGQQQRQADLGLRNNLATAGALAAGTGLIAGAAYGVHKLHDAVTYHSDFNKMMDSNPYLQEHRDRDPKYFNTAFSSARQAAPTMMKNPLIAGNLMQTMMTSSDRSGAGGVLAQAIQNETNMRRDRGMAVGPISFKPMQ
jgi:hypothetical protein